MMHWLTWSRSPLTTQPIFLVTGKLVTPSEKPQGETKILHPSNESLGCWVAVYPTHLVIGDVRPGPTKHAAYLFGAVGAYLLKPLLGSLSTSSRSYSILWEKTLWIKFNQDLREIDVCGVRKEDGHIWLVAFTCEQSEKLLRHLTSFVKVEGIDKILGEITQPRVSSESKLNDVLMEDLHDYLNSIGFNAEFANLDRSYTHKGIIRLNGANVSYIAKDTHITGSSEIIFIIEDVTSDWRGTQLVVKKKNGRISELSWDGKNERLIAILNQDQVLMKQLSLEIGNDNVTLFVFKCHKTFHALIGGKMMHKTKGKQSITIHNYTQRLPSKEYFQAIDRLAYYLRTSA
jgi:hypothetical protein